MIVKCSKNYTIFKYTVYIYYILLFILMWTLTFLKSHHLVYYPPTLALNLLPTLLVFFYYQSLSFQIIIYYVYVLIKGIF